MTPQERARTKRLADFFNLTPEMWQKIDDYQGHVCFICQKNPSVGRRLAVDHEHATGLIRGLLCARCNRCFGKLENGQFTVEMIARLLEYVTSPPAVAALGKRVYGLPGRVGTKKQRKLLKKLKKEAVFNVQLSTSAAA